MAAAPGRIPEHTPFEHRRHSSGNWACGVRNPLGIHFDVDGNFWLADVGQDIWKK